jgi:hypothetical protein
MVDAPNQYIHAQLLDSERITCLNMNAEELTHEVAQDPKSQVKCTFIRGSRIITANMEP